MTPISSAVVLTDRPTLSVNFGLNKRYDANSFITVLSLVFLKSQILFLKKVKIFSSMKQNATKGMSKYGKIMLANLR
ncbi:MAG: hypothetical protein A2Y10_19665 [Planctomycetes bacterium GWF2_41_51]|nr:MAG: hypothetical protein A2Y10_19665 [Planctomycetes bacterium GWF2_41_51]HBG28198.1 hypothetical protein [Phycisphaerales bacterium]